MVDETIKPKRRYRCAQCGKDMGEWDGRYCDSRDTCEERDCARGARDDAYAEGEEAHDRLDRYMGW